MINTSKGKTYKNRTTDGGAIGGDVKSQKPEGERFPVEAASDSNGRLGRGMMAYVRAIYGMADSDICTESCELDAWELKSPNALAQGPGGSSPGPAGATG